MRRPLIDFTICVHGIYEMRAAILQCYGITVAIGGKDLISRQTFKDARPNLTRDTSRSRDLQHRCRKPDSDWSVFQEHVIDAQKQPSQ